MFNAQKKERKTSSFNTETIVLYIGILTLPLSYNKMYHLKHNNVNLPQSVDDLRLKINSTYYNEHYEKWLNLAGIRAVPLLLNEPEGKLYQQMQQLHGILLPGGGYEQFIPNSLPPMPTLYLKKVLLIVEEAKKINDLQRYFLIWGTCLGSQALIQSIFMRPIRKAVYNNAKNYQKAGVIIEKSKLTDYIKDDGAFQTPLFYFNHKFAITLRTYEFDSILQEHIKPVIIKTIHQTDKVISYAEFRNYPFFSALYHIEKPMYHDESSLEDKRKEIQLKHAEFIRDQINENLKINIHNSGFDSTLFERPYHEWELKQTNDVIKFFYSPEQIANELYGDKPDPTQQLKEAMEKVLKPKLIIQLTFLNQILLQQISIIMTEEEETLDEIFLMIQNAKLEDCVEIMNNQYLEYEGKKMNFHVKKIGKRPPDGYLLYIGLHGGGGTEKVQQFYENHKKLYKLPQGSIWLVPQSPTNSWDHWNQEYIDAMFIKLIQTFLLSNFINPNKVYLTGFSTGGNAVFKLASRMQDVFAAVCVTGGVPKDLYLKNFRNTPFSINIGEKDFAFGRNFKIKDFQAKVDKLKDKDKKGYDFLIKSFPNQNHWLNLKETFAMNWMAQKTRNPYPNFFIWKQTSDILKQHCYYLYVEKPIPDMLIQAKQKDNKFEIETLNKVNISVRFNENLIDMEKPVQIFFNGKLYHEGLIEKDVEFVRLTAYERLDPHYTYWNEIVIKPEKL